MDCRKVSSSEQDPPAKASVLFAARDKVIPVLTWTTTAILLETAIVIKEHPAGCCCLLRLLCTN